MGQRRALTKQITFSFHSRLVDVQKLTSFFPFDFLTGIIERDAPVIQPHCDTSGRYEQPRDDLLEPRMVDADRGAAYSSHAD